MHCSFSSFSAMHLPAFKICILYQVKPVFMAFGEKAFVFFLFTYKGLQIQPSHTLLGHKQTICYLYLSFLLLVYTDQWSSRLPHLFTSVHLYCTVIYSYFVSIDNFSDLISLLVKSTHLLSPVCPCVPPTLPPLAGKDE